MSSNDEANNHPVLEDQPVPAPDPNAVPAIRFHYLEAMDSLANIAKASGTYVELINATLQVIAVMLSEIDEQHVDNVIGTLAAQAQQFREQRIAAAAEANNPTQPTTGVPHVH